MNLWCWKWRCVDKSAVLAAETKVGTRTRKRDSPQNGGSDVGNHKAAHVQSQIRERGGRFHRGTGRSISAVQIAGHHGERESRC